MSAPPPLTSTTFVDTELVTAAKLYARVFTVINYLLNLVNSGTQTRFFATILTAQAITNGVNYNWSTLGTIVEDTGSGWSSGSAAWVCPSAGTYAFWLASKCNSSAASPGMMLRKNGTQYVLGPNPASGAFSGTNIGGYIRLAVGDTVQVQALNSFTTQSDTPAHNNYLQLWQTSFA